LLTAVGDWLVGIEVKTVPDLLGRVAYDLLPDTDLHSLDLGVGLGERLKREKVE